MVQDTRDRIISQATKCLARNSGAGLEEIARAAGVGRATLYRYFESRAELITALRMSASDQLDSIIQPVLESHRPALEKLLKVVIRLIPLGASLNVSTYLTRPFDESDPRIVERYERHLAQSRKICSDLKKEGVVQADMPVKWLMASLDSLIFAAWEEVENGEIAPKRAPWLVLRTFLSGCGLPETAIWLNNKEGMV